MVVLADGSIVDTDDHQDLLWALRGAGNGSLGAVAELRIRVYPSVPLLGGILTFSYTELVPVLTKFNEMESELPQNFAGDMMLTELPGVGEAIVFWCTWVSNEDDGLVEGHKFMRKLRALGNSIVDTVSESGFYNRECVTLFSFLTGRIATYYALISGVQMPPRSKMHIRSRNISGFTTEFVDILSRRGLHPGGNIVLHFAHSAAVRPNPESSFPRSTPFRTAVLALATDDQSGATWADKIVEEISSEGIACQGSYGNLSNLQDFDGLATYGQAAFTRLQELKTRYDPDNFFSRGYPVLT
jgi:FAD/FMN-containing dehydrogenase